MDGRLIGPYQINGYLNGNRYNNFIANDLPRLLEASNVNAQRQREIWLMQDGARPHRTDAVMRTIRGRFGERVISLGARIEWPPRSPDLNPLDFFLWGHLKSIIYKNPIRDLEHLHEKIREALLSVSPEMLNKCKQNLLRRARCCLRVGGGHFENVLPHHVRHNM